MADSKTKGDKPEEGSKGITRTRVEGLIERYFNHSAKIEKIMADAKKKAEGPRADMGVVIDDADRIGINRQAFKKTLKRIRLLMKREEERDQAEADVQDAMDHLEDMIELGDVKSFDETPLGKVLAANKTAAAKPAEKEKPAAADKDKSEKTSATVTDIAKKAGATPAGAAPH